MLKDKIIAGEELKKLRSQGIRRITYMTLKLLRNIADIVLKRVTTRS